jgi:hypothetical protein
LSRRRDEGPASAARLRVYTMITWLTRADSGRSCRIRARASSKSRDSARARALDHVHLSRGPTRIIRVLPAPDPTAAPARDIPVLPHQKPHPLCPKPFRLASEGSALCELCNTVTLLPCEPSPAPIARRAPARFASGLGQGKEGGFSISWHRSAGVSRVPKQGPDTPHTHHCTKVSTCSPGSPGINVCDILRNGCAGAALRGVSARLYRPLPPPMARASDHIPKVVPFRKCHCTLGCASPHPPHHSECAP